MRDFLKELTEDELDEIVSIEYIGIEDTIDINVTGDRLFWANDVLTHNCAVDETEFDHSHISGGLSKIQTADNVIGIYTSRAMKERGRYQIQFMKTRSSNGVGQKVDLGFDMDTLKIYDLGEDEDNESLSQKVSVSQASSNVLNGIKRTSVISDNDEDVSSDKKVNAVASTSKIRDMLKQLNAEKD